MTHEQGPVDGDQPRAPGESVNETTAEGREEGSAAKEEKNGGPVPGEPALPAKPPRPSSGGGQPGTTSPGAPSGGPPQQMQAAKPAGAPRPPGGDPRSSAGSAPSPVSGPRTPRPPQPPRPVGPPPAAQQQPARTVVNHPPAVQPPAQVPTGVPGPGGSPGPVGTETSPEGVGEAGKRRRRKKKEKTPDQAKKTRNQLRKLGLTAFVLWSVSCLLAGLVGGWFLNERIQAGRSEAGPSVIEIPAAQQSPELAMPDLRGMGLVDAKQVLADSGVALSSIEISEVEWGGDAGFVVAQEPVGGEAVASVIKLRVSKPALMPNVVGLSQTEAVEALKRLGVEVEVEERFDLASRTGTVLEASVATGEPLPSAVKVIVAQAGMAVYLSKVKAEGYGCSAFDAKINGTAYVNSVKCGSGRASSPSKAVWLIDRKAYRLSGLVGVDDRGDSDDAVQVIVTGDGVELANVTATYAKPAEVNVSVEKVLRLEITVTSEKNSNVILGNMILKGIPEQIATLETNR